VLLIAIEGSKALGAVLDHAARSAVITVTEQDTSGETGAAADIAKSFARHFARECMTCMAITIAAGEGTWYSEHDETFRRQHASFWRLFL